MLFRSAHFGLGKATRAEIVEVKWPSGLKQVFQCLDANQFYLIEEGRDQLALQRFAHKTSIIPQPSRATKLDETLLEQVVRLGKNAPT